jgi:hypothetical protein
MDVATVLLKATLTGIKNGTVKPDPTQWAVLEDAGLVKNFVLTKAAWMRLEHDRVSAPVRGDAHRG